MRTGFVKFSLESPFANPFVCVLFTQNNLAPYFSELNLLLKIFFQHANLMTSLACSSLTTRLSSDL